MANNNYVAIMAGGVGSRFWPASTENRPKQFLDILGVGKSLIRLTYERFLKIVPNENILIVTNKVYKAQVAEHLPELPLENILCEPSRNNTAPCVAYTAMRLRAMNENAVFVTAPSDHVILKEDAFLEKIQTAFEVAGKNDVLLTLGITPTRPDTGYGYIRYEAAEGEVKKVRQFTEKPDLETAKSFLASGDYLWNAGIFVWSAKSILASFGKNAPEIVEILEAGKDAYNTPDEQAFVDEAYPRTPSISVDYAIMEKAQNVHTIPSDIGWSDLGTWGSLYAFRDKDETSNVADGKIVIQDTTNSLIRGNKDKLTIVRGLDDYIIVDEDNALLIYPKSAEQEIKKLVKQLKDQ